MKKITLLLLIFMGGGLLLRAQVRPDINSFSSGDRTLLATLMQQYITTAVIEDHCVHMMITGGHVHSDFDFLPFHRMYIERMEDYLLEQGYPQFVPLPAWNPETGGVPLELQVVDPDCGSAICDASHPAFTCGQPINWNPGNALPANLKLPVVPGANNDLCDHNMDPTWPNPAPGMSGNPSPTGLSRRIETGWHDGVHINMAGVMGNFRSPAVPAFWLWHAYVDDVWKRWECNCPQSPMVGQFDLYMKDNHMVVPSERDRGEEPDIDMGPMWTSQDIWVRNQNDGLNNFTHQNPEYMAISGNDNYVYVIVRNRGCVANAGTEDVKLYWAKAATALSWDTHWNGSITSPALMGDIIGTQDAPVIAPGSARVLEYPWHVPDPAVYAAVGTDPIFYANEPWHFCLLARIDDATDPMAAIETPALGDNVRKNNNIVWKNVSVVDLNPFNIVGPGGPWDNDRLVGATVLVGDLMDHGGLYGFEFRTPANSPITERAEIKITLDKPVWTAWKQTGFAGENIQIVNEARRQIIVRGANARLYNVPFGKSKRNLIHVSFNFLSRKMEGVTNGNYKFEVIQLDANNVAVGGEAFEVRYPGRATFYADAGPDKNIQPGQATELVAHQIDEPAIYNWYDGSGNLVSTGPVLQVVPTSTQTYKLEVIAKADGVKDYDEARVNVGGSVKITSIFPNPATDYLKIEYQAEGASSAYFVLSNTSTGAQKEFTIDPKQNGISINISEFVPGAYKLILVCDGKPADTKAVIIQ